LRPVKIALPALCTKPKPATQQAVAPCLQANKSLAKAGAAPTLKKRNSRSRASLKATFRQLQQLGAKSGVCILNFSGRALH
jgi:hypothetical protein